MARSEKWSEETATKLCGQLVAIVGTILKVRLWNLFKMD